MARTASPQNVLRSLVDDFVSRLVATIEADASQRAKQMVMTALEGGTLPRRRGRPPKFASFAKIAISGGSGRRRPKQLCPVPGCNNAAAPVFGMVCKDHRDVPKSQIKKFREARRAEKSKS